MSSFLDTISRFPTAIWTVLLGVVLLYWIAAMVGFVDIDALDVDGEAGDFGDLSGKLMALGLGGVPFSIVISLITLTGWLVSCLADQYLVGWLPGWLHYLAGAALLLLSFAVALPVTAAVLRPMRGLFVSHNAIRNPALVGSACKVLTLKVTERFGQAEVAGAGASINLRVRASTPNTLTRGTRAVIVDYDAASGSYTIAALDDS
ncbi:ubiquinone biosynthesis protein [Chitinolyticbacter meiyuanensis]|uniref:ubiquinone biosynthesis protein n=1 Tax=Chitinolyticbacter meiyuanensis TaxID=682798 RepID=UPI0011E5BA4A|nr:ubiquinone biosynthesis protein [Chitinolyticbacter meiyuanensis]